MTVLFEQALERAVEKAEFAITGIGNEITLIRDLRGKVRVLLPGNQKDYKDDKQIQLDKFINDLSESLGVYGFPPERSLLFISDLAQGEQSVELSGRRLIAEKQGSKIWLLDRQIIGQDWMKMPFDRKTKNPRVTFFGIKGGVGRSTALVIWAWWLAKQGKKVLIFDLDLESPGVSSTLLPLGNLPDFGIVDWFVEDGVGQSTVIEKEMIASSPLAGNLSGDIRLAPAYGCKTGEYLPKLARCYSETILDDGVILTWGDRLEHLVEKIEFVEKPDVVILDSRAGIHDIAAVTITRMNADVFLFAVDSPQTWSAYTFLFRHWNQYPQQVKTVRKHLQIIASMIPETGREEYLKRFTEHAWDVFLEHLYDEAVPGETVDFSFDLNDENAPHYPLPIFWQRALQEFDPINSKFGLDEKTTKESLGIFMDKADQFVDPVGEEE